MNSPIKAGCQQPGQAPHVINMDVGEQQCMYRVEGELDGELILPGTGAGGLGALE